MAFFKDQRAGRACFYTGSAALAFGLAEGPVAKGAHHSSKAAFGKSQGPYPQTFPAYPHAPAAEDAFVGVICENGVTGVYRELSFQLP